MEDAEASALAPPNVPRTGIRKRPRASQIVTRSRRGRCTSSRSSPDRHEFARAALRAVAASSTATRPRARRRRRTKRGRGGRGERGSMSSPSSAGLHERRELSGALSRRHERHHRMAVLLRPPVIVEGGTPARSLRKERETRPGRGRREGQTLLQSDLALTPAPVQTPPEPASARFSSSSSGNRTRCGGGVQGVSGGQEGASVAATMLQEPQAAVRRKEKIGRGALVPSDAIECCGEPGSLRPSGTARGSGAAPCGACPARSPRQFR